MSGSRLRVDADELAGLRRELTDAAAHVERTLGAARRVLATVGAEPGAAPEALALLAGTVDGLHLLGPDLARDAASLGRVAEAYQRTEEETTAALRALTARLGARSEGRPQAVDEQSTGGHRVLDGFRPPRPQEPRCRRAQRAQRSQPTQPSQGRHGSHGALPHGALPHGALDAHGANGRHRGLGPHGGHGAGGMHAAHLTHLAYLAHFAHGIHLAHRAHAERLTRHAGRWAGPHGGHGGPGGHGSHRPGPGTGGATGLTQWHAPSAGAHGVPQPRPCATARPAAPSGGPPLLGHWPFGPCPPTSGSGWLTPQRPARQPLPVSPQKPQRPPRPRPSRGHGSGSHGHPHHHPHGHPHGHLPGQVPDHTPHRSPARETILRRAARWAAHPVPYSMAARHHGWRADCSGFVSMAWGLDRSYTTVTLPRVSHRIHKGELRPGDALLNRSPGRYGHVVLFERWADSAHTAYYGYEQSPGGTKHRRIPYPYFPGHGRFVPYRLNRLGR